MTLEGCALEGLTLEGFTLEGCALEGAALEGATLEGAALERLAPARRSRAAPGPTMGTALKFVSVTVGEAASRGSASAGVVRSRVGISTPSNCSIGSPSSACSM